jgi:parallel beta-helix repeat protein
MSRLKGLQRILASTKRKSKPFRRSSPQRFRPRVESIEARLLLSTITVTNLNDAGTGSLRQAILEANALPGKSVEQVNFAVAGTITLTSGPLAPISHPLNINGTSAPGFLGTPLVEIDANGFAGLQFTTRSTGSALRSLGLVDASGDAVTLGGHDITVVGDFIGLELDGSTPAGNGGSGVVINPTSYHDTIGATSTFGPLISLASNVISSNGGNGIVVNGSSRNRLIANYIGTDVTGTLARGNGGNGVVLTGGSHGNTIGGIIPFVNAQNIVPLSNLISGNQGDGVLITGKSSTNLMAANLIGTNNTGNVALGNRLDGVTILNGSNRNVLTGTRIGQAPFIYANIIDGNGGNGLRVSNSNNTVIQANFFGLGYDNKTPVGNALDGLLIEGTSANTQDGGVIPLGNVNAANGGNGDEIRDTARGTVVFNNFIGLAAFQDYTNLGNGLDGMLISSTGGNNTIRTSIITENQRDGIEITGQARGVVVEQVFIGINTNGSIAMPNGMDGISISGNAHNNTIGGFIHSVVPQTTISANLGDGVSFTGTAHNNSIVNTFIGTDFRGKTALGNGGAGVFLGSGTFANTIGGTQSKYANLISGNLGDGVDLNGTFSNTLAANLIGVQAPDRVRTSLLPLSNGGNGISITSSFQNLIGGKTAGAANTIDFNAAAGVLVNSGSGNAILRNSIAENQGPGIVLQPGANANQAAPVLAGVAVNGRCTVILGTLTSTPNSTFLIQLFANAPTAPAPVSSGQTYLASQTVTTNALGVASIRFMVLNQSTSNIYTTTATSAIKNTSPFSNSVASLTV